MMKGGARTVSIIISFCIHIISLFELTIGFWKVENSFDYVSCFMAKILKNLIV